MYNPVRSTVDLRGLRINEVRTSALEGKVENLPVVCRGSGSRSGMCRFLWGRLGGGIWDAVPVYAVPVDCGVS